jgi:SET domain
MKVHKKDWKIKKSKIHGKGIYLTKSFKKNEQIGVGIDYYLGFLPYVTSEFGSWINHSFKPNTRLEYSDKDKVYYIISNEYLPSNTELTLDYKKTPFYIQGPGSDFK